MTHTTTDAAEARALLDKLETHDVHTGYDEGGNFVYEDYVRLADVRELLATAEAASGAGEREELRKLLTDGWYRPGHSHPVLSVDADAWIKQVQAIGLRVLASLPPATDRAMVETDLEAAAKLACETFYGNAWQWDALGLEFQQRWRDVASAALAAAPTIPAMGEGKCPSSPDGRHQVDTSMESGPNNCFHCEASMGGK